MMSKEQLHLLSEKAAWIDRILKGALLTVVAYFAVETHATLKTAVAQLDEHKTRIAVIETEIKYLTQNNK